MAKRERQNELKIYLSDDEQYILEQKWKASNTKSKSTFIRHLILYGYVYDVNYEHLQEYNTILSRIGNNLNQIAKRMNATGNVYEADIKEVKELMKQVWQSQKSMGCNVWHLHPVNVIVSANHMIESVLPVHCHKWHSIIIIK